MLGWVDHCLPTEKAHVSIDGEASSTGLWTECPGPSSTLSSHIEALSPRGWSLETGLWDGLGSR